jgi:methyl-accepting chemotaxis protein
MDRVTQQNASLVGESAAAAENMAGQAEHLVRVVARFTLDTGVARGEGGTSVPHAPIASLPARAAQGRAARVAAPAAPAFARTREGAPAERASIGTAPDDGWQEF